MLTLPVGFMARVSVDEQAPLTVGRAVFGLQKRGDLSAVVRVQSRFETGRIGQFVDGSQRICGQTTVVCEARNHTTVFG